MTPAATAPWIPPLLPPAEELETRAVLKKLSEAHRALAELKGIAASIPNQQILLSTLPLQEAKDSSAVENIITTHDELYRAGLQPNDAIQSLAAKEVQRYAAALRVGYDLVRRNGFLSLNHVIQIQQTLENNEAGLRRVPSTALKNERTGEVVFTPPQDYDTILRLMSNLEAYLNDDTLSDVDPLVKMAVLHFQFESIHPFYDGNGRTGRIINLLYLVLKDLLHLPVLYLSRYVIQHKADYYRLLQGVRDEGGWERWLLWWLEGITLTARSTITLIEQMRQLMQTTKVTLRTNYRFYSQDLLNNLFRHPYTKIEFVQQELSVSRITAASYLNQLAADGLLEKQRIGTTNFYINRPLFTLLTAVG